MDYNFKTHILTYTFDDHLKAGKNTFELIVTDKVENQSIYTREIIS